MHLCQQKQINKDFKSKILITFFSNNVLCDFSILLFRFGIITNIEKKNSFSFKT